MLYYLMYTSIVLWGRFATREPQFVATPLSERLHSLRHKDSRGIKAGLAECSENPLDDLNKFMYFLVFT